MFSVIVIIFQAIALLFLGIFARTINIDETTFSSYSPLVADSFTLLLAFTFMYSPFRKLSLASFALLLITIGVTVQTEMLFDAFWSSCFNGFESTFTVKPELLIQCAFASLAVSITVLDFMGLFGYWQIYFLMSPIMTIGYSLVQNIINFGLKTFDGGGGMSVFLYSGMCSLMIWALCIRGKVNYDRLRIKQSYVNQTLSLIGVVIAFANWPKFNMGGAVATSSQIAYIDASATSVSNLENSALGNTFLGLAAAILTSILFASKDSKEDKMKVKIYIDCFINGGIVIASYQDIALNPSVCIVMACFSTIITLIVHKYFLTTSETSSESTFKDIMKNYSKIIFRIIFAILGSIIGSIVVATRSGATPALLPLEYSRTAGLQLVGFIITIVLGALFGLITAASINFFLKTRQNAQQKQQQGTKHLEEQISDVTFFDGFLQEAHPLYYDIFEQINRKEEEKINIHDYTTKVIRQSLLGAQQNPLRMISVTKPFETKVDPNQAARPHNDFSKRNDFAADVSQMKGNNNRDSDFSERQNQSAVQPNQPVGAQKSNLKIAEFESIPRQDPKVARKLFQEDQLGSQIKNEKVSERPFLH